jgi:hypothetical protein
MTVTPPMAGKIVLITGGTGGIGRAVAIGLTSRGARVGITGRERAERAAAIARKSGNPAVDVFVADMSPPTRSPPLPTKAWRSRRPKRSSSNRPGTTPTTFPVRRPSATPTTGTRTRSPSERGRRSPAGKIYC